MIKHNNFVFCSDNQIIWTCIWLVCCSKSWYPISCNWPTTVWPLTLSTSYWWNSEWIVHSSDTHRLTVWGPTGETADDLYTQPQAGGQVNKRTNKQANNAAVAMKTHFCCQVNKNFCCHVNRHFCCQINSHFCCHVN